MGRYGTPDWNPQRPQVPVDKDGNWQHFPYAIATWEVIERPFWAVLEIGGLNTGRSAKYLTLKNTETGVTYPMFVSDLVKGIQHSGIIISDGKMSAWWAASKRGANYGIKPVPQP